MILSLLTGLALAQEPAPLYLPDRSTWGVPVYTTERARIWVEVAPGHVPPTTGGPLPLTTADGLPLPDPRERHDGRALPASTADGTPLPNPWAEGDPTESAVGAGGGDGVRLVRRRPALGWRVAGFSVVGVAGFAGSMLLVSGMAPLAE